MDSDNKDNKDQIQPEESKEEKKPWGKLTSITIRQSNIELIDKEYNFGRASSNNVFIPDKRLSSVHCKIVFEDDGKAYVIDLSTNGTFLDNDKIGKNTKKELNSGDKVYLLHHSKVSAEDVLGFIFSYKNNESSALKKQREEDLKAIAEQKELTEKQIKLADDLGEEMKCCICIDYIYQCVTLVPCLHNFCASCFSDWMQKSVHCPNCRDEVMEVKKNSTINNIVEKYLDAHSEKKRTKAEYDEMDKHNKIIQDRLILKDKPKKKAEIEDEEDEDEDEYDEDEEEEEEDEDNDCVECVTARASDGFKCNPSNKKHLYCGACYRPFPDRKDHFPQECVICHQAYCNLYIPCNRPRSTNKLEFLENYQVPYTLQVGIFRGNHYEVKVLNDFLNQQKMNPRDLFTQFLRDYVDANNFRYKINRALFARPTQANFDIAIGRKSPVCTRCFDSVWFQIVFRFREGVNKQLPTAIANRPTCWYGINCRTMIHKPDHAQKLNHICEQTKF